MNPLCRITPFVARHRGLAWLIIAVLPLILVACTNGGSGPSY